MPDIYTLDTFLKPPPSAAESYSLEEFMKVPSQESPQESYSLADFLKVPSTDPQDIAGIPQEQQSEMARQRLGYAPGPAGYFTRAVASSDNLAVGMGQVIDAVSSWRDMALKIVGAPPASNAEDVRRYAADLMQINQPEEFLSLFDGDNKLGRSAKFVWDNTIQAIPFMGAIGLGGAATVAASPFAISAGTGAAIASIALSQGAAYSDLKERGVDNPGIAAIVGVPIGLLEMVTPGRIGQRLGFIPKAALKDAPESILRAMRTGFVEEGATEMFQEWFQAAAEKYAGVGDDPWTIFTRGLNAAAAGAVAGSTLSGLSRTIAPSGPPREIVPDDETLVDTPQLPKASTDPEPVPAVDVPTPPVETEPAPGKAVEPTPEPKPLPGPAPTTDEGEQRMAMNLIEGFQDAELDEYISAGTVKDPFYQEAMEGEQTRRKARVDPAVTPEKIWDLETTARSGEVVKDAEAFFQKEDPTLPDFRKFFDAYINLADQDPQNAQTAAEILDSATEAWKAQGMPKGGAKVIGQMERAWQLWEDRVKQKAEEELNAPLPTVTLNGRYVRDARAGTLLKVPDDQDLVSGDIKEYTNTKVLDLSTEEAAREVFARSDYLDPEKGSEIFNNPLDLRSRNTIYDVAQQLGFEGVQYKDGTVDILDTAPMAGSDLTENLGQTTPKVRERAVEEIRTLVPGNVRELEQAPTVRPSIMDEFREGQPRKAIPVVLDRSSRNTAGPDIQYEFADSELAQQMGAIYSDTLEDVMDKFEAHADEFSHPLLGRLREFISGMGFQISNAGLWGEFKPTRSDYRRNTVVYNPFLSQGDPVHHRDLSGFLAAAWDNLIHELTHVTAFHEYTTWDPATQGDLSDFPKHLGEALAIAEPLREIFERRLTDVIGDETRSDGFSSSFTRWAYSIQQGRLRPSLKGGKGRGAAGRTAGGPGTGRSSPGSTVSPGSGESVSSQEPEGAPDEGIRNEIQDGYKGDYPAPSPEYLRYVQNSDNAPTQRYGGWEPEATNAPIADVIRRVSNGVDPAATEEIVADVMVNRSRLKMFRTLLQVTKANKHVPGVMKHVKLVRDFWRSKTRTLMLGDGILKNWSKMAKADRVRLGSFIYDVTLDSFKKKRRLDVNEIRSMRSKHGINDRLYRQYTDIDESLGRTLRMLQDALEKNARETLGPFADLKIHRIREEFESMRNRNFFPLSRFGKYAVFAKARQEVTIDGETYKPGQTITMATFTNEKDQADFARELRSKLSTKQAQVKANIIEVKGHQQFLNFSPAMEQLVGDVIKATPEQRRKLRELLYSFSPGRSFVKHLKRKRGIAGFSTDAIRSYAEYMQHASNHIARAEWKNSLEANLNNMLQLAKQQEYSSNKLDELNNFLGDHYNDLMNPNSSLAGVRGFLFTYFFAFNPKQAVVNLTQLPVFAFPWLAKHHGGPVGVADGMTASLMAKAIKDLSLKKTSWTGLTQEERDSIEWGKEEGTLGQSYATYMAGVAGGESIGHKSGYFHKLIGRSETASEMMLTAEHLGRTWVQASTKMFSMSEDANRHITWLSAYRLARKQGQTHEQANQFAQQAVDETMFEYAAWNRPKAMRGKASVMFVFRLYQEHVLDGIAHNTFGWRFWAVQLAAAGAMGLPFADDMKEWLNTFVSMWRKKTGWKDPYFDAEAELKKVMNAAGKFGDFMMYGAAQDPLGLVGLDFLGGTMPQVDLTSSISLGRQVPALPPIMQAFRGTKGSNEAALQAMEEIVGVAAPTGLNFFRAATENNPSDIAYVRAFPNFLKNLRTAIHMYQTGEIQNSFGTPLAPVDVNNPAHIGEIVGRAMGLYPTRASQAARASRGARETVAYYTVWRDSILTEFTKALAANDKDGIDEARRELIRFQTNAPKEFRMDTKGVERSLLQRLTNDSYRTLGLPTKKSLIPLYQEYQRVYQEPQ